MAKKIKANRQMQKSKLWIDARRYRHLSHGQVQMARELGLNPAKLGKLDNHKQEPGKLPLPRFIEQLYFERFGKTTPDNDRSIDQLRRVEAAQTEARRASRQQHAMGNIGRMVREARDAAAPLRRADRGTTRGGDGSRRCRIEVGSVEPEPPPGSSGA
jgi:hypothetical protein